MIVTGFLILGVGFSSIYRLKMIAEEHFENNQEDLTREYEEFRFESRNDYEHIAIQCYCENCEIKQNMKLRYLDLRNISM